MSHGLNQQSHRVVVVSLLEFWSIHSSQSGAEAAGVIVAETADHLQGWQVAVCNKLLELTVPFVESPKIGIGLIVSPEIWVIKSVLSEKLIRRRGLDDAGSERISDGICDGSDAARRVGHPAVVAYRSSSLQPGVEDISLRITRGTGCCRVAAVTSQDVGGAAAQRRSGSAVGCRGACWVKE